MNFAGSALCLFLALISKLDAIGMILTLPFTYLLFQENRSKKLLISVGVFLFFLLIIFLGLRAFLIESIVPIQNANSVGSQVLFTENQLLAQLIFWIK